MTEPEVGGLSVGETILFAAGAVITLALLVGTIIFGVVIHRADRREREAERSRQGGSSS